MVIYSSDNFTVLTRIKLAIEIEFNENAIASRRVF